MMFESRSIGIDIQQRSVKIAVASNQSGRMKVLDLIEKPVPETSEQETKVSIASIIKQAFSEHGLDGDTCVACLPAGSSINRLLTTPISDTGKIRQTLKFQMEPQIPYPVDRVISDFIEIRKTSAGTDLLAIAVTKDLIGEKLEVFEAAGLDPQILTLDALALANLYINPFDFSAGRTTVLLRSDYESSFLGFFNGEKLFGYRNLGGFRPGDENAAKKMVKELQRSILAFQSSETAGEEIGTICVAGPNAESLRGLLQESFRDHPVKVVGFNESAAADIPGPFLNDVLEYELAIALAHAGLGSSKNTVNFRREEYSPVPMLKRVKPNLLFSLTVLAIALVAWFASVAAWNRHQSHQLAILNEEMLKIFSDTLPGIKSPESLQQKIREEKEKFKLLKNYSSLYVPPLDVLAEVTAGIPGGKTITLMDLAVSDYVLRMTGEGDSFDDINIFKGRLEDSPLLHEVKIESATKAEKGNKINFRIRAGIGYESAAGTDLSRGDKA